MLLLDIDDTLLQNTRAEELAALEFGYANSSRIRNFDAASFVDRWKVETRKAIDLFLNGAASFVEQRRVRIRAIFEIALSDSECDQLFAGYLERYVAAWSLYDDVLPFLERHSGEVVGVISDGSHAQQLQKLEATGIIGFFRHVFTKESLGISKRSPQAYVAVCEHLGIEPAKLSYIGDNLETDVIVPGSLGIRSIWLNRYGHPVPPGVTSLSSLCEYIAGSSISVNARGEPCTSDFRCTKTALRHGLTRI